MSDEAQGNADEILRNAWFNNYEQSVLEFMNIMEMIAQAMAALVHRWKKEDAGPMDKREVDPMMVLMLTTICEKWEIKRREMQRLSEEYKERFGTELPIRRPS